jgi:hypothetical protein
VQELPALITAPIQACMHANQYFFGTPTLRAARLSHCWMWALDTAGPPRP